MSTVIIRPQTGRVKRYKALSKPNWKKFDKPNLEAAAIILSDVDLHGGEEALAVRWARLFMAAREPVATVQQQPQTSFFAEVA